MAGKNKVTRLVPERQRTTAGLVEGGLTQNQARAVLLKLDRDQNDVMMTDEDGNRIPTPGSRSITEA